MRRASHLGGDLNELYFDVLRSPHRPRGGKLVLEVDDVLSQSLRVLVSSSDGDSNGLEVGEISMLGLEVAEGLDGLKVKEDEEEKVSFSTRSVPVFVSSQSGRERTLSASVLACSRSDCLVARVALRPGMMVDLTDSARSCSGWSRCKEARTSSQRSS